MKPPASDLVHDGRPIDESEAGELIRRGVELWRLNPEESVLWKNSQLEISDAASQQFPAEGATVRFDSYLASTGGLFRASVDSGEVPEVVRPFTLSVSLSSSAALMRAALLRRIGYQVSSPRLYHALTLRFGSLEERSKFLDNLSDRSLTSRARWVKSLPDDKPEVTLQGVVLEPGRIRVQTVYWGLMSAALQRDRRVFRALLVPDVLMDFQEKVNSFAWETGRVFNGSAVFDYLFSDAFQDVTIDDVKWVTARIAALSREELAAAVAEAGLPPDIGELIAEKVVARRNSLVRLVGLSPLYGQLEERKDVNRGLVLHGQLTSGDYPGWPQEFYDKPGLPPLRFSQLWRFGAIEGISAGLSQLLAQVNDRLLTYESTTTAMQKHQDAVSKGMGDYLFRTGSLNGYQQTTGVWGRPLGGAHINASRSVVAGTYLGSDSQVQMVDTLAVDVGAGFYLGWDGSASFLPGVSGQVTLSRSYSHVRPVQDMDTALKTNWGRLAVVQFMRGLGATLDPDIRCTIPEGAFTSEFDLNGKKITKVVYDLKRPNGREEALELRAKLIAGGASADQILLEGKDRESDCIDEVQKSVDKNLGDFMDGLATGETFIITDSVMQGSSANVTIPVAQLLGAQVSVTPGVSQGYEIARQTMIRKTAGGFQVYLQDRRLDSASAGLDLNFFVNVMSVQKGYRHGKADTDFYSIATEGADVETKRKLVRSLRALLRDNSSEILTDSFQPYSLKHDLMAKLLKFRFLLWSKDSEKQEHEVEILPPLDPKGERNRGDFKRTLAMRRLVTRTGQDWFGFLMGVAGRLTGGIVSLPGVSQGGDPGNNPGGSSVIHSISTQAEVTPTAAFKPVTAVEETYRGWLMSKKDLFKIFDRIEAAYGGASIDGQAGRNALFHRSLFNNTSRLELYQLDTTLMFYPEALEQVRNWLFRDFGEKGLFDHLVRLNGARKTEIYCDIAASQFGRNGPQVYRGREVHACAPDWVHAVMRMRSQGLPSDRREQLAWYNSLMSQLMGGADVASLMRSIDSRNYFFVTRINGFRRGDMAGAVDYLSDTVGRYDNERGVGMYHDFASAYGISLFELYARFFTEGL